MLQLVNLMYYILSTKENVNLETLGFLHNIHKYAAITTPASKVVDRVGITRSVTVNALRKFESAGVIESRSS